MSKKEEKKIEKLPQASGEERKVLSRYFINFLIHDVMNGIDHEDILRVPMSTQGKAIPNVIYCKGERLPAEHVVKIYEEATEISKSKLWSYLMKDMHYHSTELLKKAKTEDDMYVAKLMLLWTKEVQRALNKFIVH